MNTYSSRSLYGVVAFAVLVILGGQFALKSYFESRRETQVEAVAGFDELPSDWDMDLASGETQVPGSFKLELDGAEAGSDAVAFTANGVTIPAGGLGVSSPEKLPVPERAAPINEKIKAQDAKIRAIIKRELPSATEDEQKIWLDRLRGMSFQDIQFLLEMRGQDLLDLRPQFEAFDFALKSDEKSAIPRPVQGAVQPDLNQLLLQQKSLELAQSSLMAVREAQSVILNNIANANTYGFKRSQILFEDLHYRTAKVPGTQDDLGILSPVGISVGMGSRISGTRVDHRQGQLLETGNELDLAIAGEGFFQVSNGDEILYTRTGTFSLNTDGEIVMTSAEKGRLLEPAITVPQGVTEIMISGDGRVSVLQPPANTLTEIGQFQTVKFINPQGLLQRGENVFAETSASGNPQQGAPGVDGRGSIKSGFLEASNVDLTREMIEWKRLQVQLQVLSQIAGLPVVEGISPEDFTNRKQSVPAISSRLKARASVK